MGWTFVDSGGLIARITVRSEPSVRLKQWRFTSPAAMARAPVRELPAQLVAPGSNSHARLISARVDEPASFIYETVLDS